MAKESKGVAKELCGNQTQDEVCKDSIGDLINDVMGSRLSSALESKSIADQSVPIKPLEKK